MIGTYHADDLQPWNRRGFVGRDSELATLRAALMRAIGGTGGLILIGGEAGIGKTALAEVFAAWGTDRGALSVVGRCHGVAGVARPLGLWQDLVFGLAEAQGETLAGDAPPSCRSDEIDRATAFATIRSRLMAQAARQPLLLVLDDLHWADPDSSALLHYLACYLATMPVLILATYRTDLPDADDCIALLLPSLVREGSVARLGVGPLASADLRALASVRYTLPPRDEDRLVAYLTRRSDGNPLFAGELMRGLEESRDLVLAGDSWRLGALTAVRLPALLRQIAEARVAPLGARAREHLALAAAIGATVPLALWRAVGAADEGVLEETIDRAFAARLIEEGGTGRAIRFTHAVLREALYEGVSPARRLALHRRIAAQLRTVTRPDRAALDHHLAAAGDEEADDRAVRAAARGCQAATDPVGLSIRELEVLRHVALGLTNAQVATRLSVAPRTINAHLTNIYAKLDVVTRTAAVRFAIDRHLL